MKKLQRLLAMFLAVVMVVTVLPSMPLGQKAWAAENLSKIFCFGDNTGNSYWLKWADSAYKGEDLKVMVYKKAGESGTETNITASFAGKLYSSDDTELVKEGQNYILPYEKYRNSSNEIPLQILIPSDKQYQDEHGNTYEEGYRIGLQMDDISWKNAATITENSEGMYFSFTDSDQMVAHAPAVVFADGVHEENYVVQYNWLGATKIGNGKTAIVNNNHETVSCMAEVGRNYIDENGDERTDWLFGSDYFTYKDLSNYGTVKLTQDIVENGDTYSWWLLYVPTGYNGEDVTLQYKKVRGTEYDATKVIESRTPSLTQAYLTVQKEDGTVLKNKEFLSSSNGKSTIGYKTFVEDAVDEETGVATKIYPSGENKYLLFFGENAKIDGVKIDGTKEIILNWKIPGNFDSKDGIREAVAKKGESLVEPKFTPIEVYRDRYYTTSLQWFYRSAKDAEWEKLAAGNTCKPSQNGYYLCSIGLRKSLGDVIWTEEQEYHVSLVDVSPIAFYVAGKSTLQKDPSVSVRATLGQDLTLEPDAQTAGGYDVKWQWYKNNTALDGKTTTKLTLKKVTSEDLGTYKLVGTAYISGETSPCYEATYTAAVVDHKYFFDKTAETWTKENQNLTLELGVGDTINAKIPIATEGYTTEYQWYKRVYQMVDDYYLPESGGINEAYTDWEHLKNINLQVPSETEGAPAEDKNYSIIAKYEKMEGQTQAGLMGYQLTNDDFAYGFDTAAGKQYYTVYGLLGMDAAHMFKCQVKITGPEEYVKEFEESLDIAEVWHFTEVYAAGKSDNKITVAKETAITLVSPKYGVDPGYQVLYQWQKKEYKLDESGEKIWNAAKKEYEYEWKDLKEISSDNTCETGKISQEETYRVKIFPGRKNSEAPLTEAEEIIKEYEISLQAQEKAELNNLYRTTPGEFRVKLGDRVKMGVKAQFTGDTSDVAVSYQWYLKGEKLENATAEEYTIPKVDVRHFGTYSCMIKAETISSKETIGEGTLTFTVAENTGIIISEPEVDVIMTKKVGETAVLSVQASSETDDQLSYSWYRIDRNTKSKTFGQEVKLEGENTASLTLRLTEKDFTQYYCRVSNTRGKSEIRRFDVNNEALTNVVTAQNGVTVIDKRLGESAVLNVVASAETAGGSFSYQWYKGETEKTALRIEGAVKPTLNLQKLEEDSFGKYLCIWTYTKDDYVLSQGSVTIQVARIWEETADSFEAVSEYGEADNDGRNRIGDSVRFGISPSALNQSSYTYRWTFIEQKAYEEEIETERILEKTRPVLEISALSEEDFGVYELTVYDGEGHMITPCDQNGEEVRTIFHLFAYEKDPVITLEGKEKIAATLGGEAELLVSVVTDSKEPVTYQWFKYSDGKYQAIYGATKASYLLRDLKESDFAQYRIKATCGDSTTYKNITLYKTANLKLNHTVLPMGPDNRCCYIEQKDVGGQVTFAVDASADPGYEITYQWFDSMMAGKGKRIPEAVSNSYTISDIKESDYGMYGCTVKAGVDEETVLFLLLPPDEFLNLVETEADGTIGVLTPREKNKNSYTEHRQSTVGTRVTLKPDVRTSAKQLTYQWYHYDQVQRRYIEIQGENGQSLNPTVTEEDLLDDDLADQELDEMTRGDYKCVILAPFRTIEYHVNFTKEKADDGRTMLVASMGAFVDSETPCYGVNPAGNRRLSEAAAEQTGFALENAPIKLVVTDQKKNAGRQYQWFVQSETFQYKKVEGKTGLEYSFRAPTVKNVVPGDGKLQNDIESSRYICVAYEDGRIAESVSYTLYSIKTPKVLNVLPKAYRYGNRAVINGKETEDCDIKGYYTANARSQTFQFAPNYEKKATMVFFDRNGDFAVYGENQEIAGKSILVNTDLAVMFYYNTVTDQEAYMAEIADMVARGKSHGYAAVSVKAATSGAGTGKTVTPNIKANPVKTLKAKKKKVSVKAGKTVVLTFKVTAQDKSAKPTDEPIVKLSGKAAKKPKVVKTTVSAKTVKVKIKTAKKKKGTMKVALKMGKKTAKVTVSVK